MTSGHLPDMSCPLRSIVGSGHEEMVKERLLPVATKSILNFIMARSGYALGAQSGHVVTQRETKPKPSRRKGVSFDIVERRRKKA
jgi:Ribosomal protein L36e